MHRSRNKRQSANRKWPWLLAVTGTVLGLATLLLNVAPFQATKNPGSTSKMAEELSLEFSLASEFPRHARPDLAGPDSCAECHRTKYDEYRQTKHPYTCRPVAPEKMPAGFNSVGRFQSVHPQIEFAMSRDATNFYQTSYAAGSAGEVTHRTKIDLVLGAGGTADDVFLSWRDDGQLRELPMAWLYPTNEWAASHFDPMSGGDFSRAMTMRCVECHNTWVEHVIGTANTYRREGAILGVTCESCHGPAGEHVRFHRSNPGQKMGLHIASPAKLDRERRIEVCTQCHSNAMRHRGHAFAYRPGQPLDQFYKTLATKATEDDRVANQITYLRQSKCFQLDERMTCVTCHNPHQANNSLNSGSTSCSKCHQPSDCHDAPNLPDEVRGDCVSCHMPSYLKINVNFQTQHDNFLPPIRRTEHRIAVHSQARDETLWNYYRAQPGEPSQQLAREFAGKLVKHFKNEAERCRKEFRFLGTIAARREVVRFDDRPEHRDELRAAVKIQTDLDLKFLTAMGHLAQNDVHGGMAAFQDILAMNPHDAKAHGRLGLEFAKLGDRQRASFHLQSVAKHDPNDVYGVAMLAWLAYLDGNHEEALRLYSQAEEIEPREAKMKYQIALAMLKLERIPQAIGKLKQALEIEPLHPESLQAMVSTLLAAGRAPEAIEYAERAARATNSENAHVLAMLAEVYATAGDRLRATTAYRMAMRSALAQDPSIIPGLQQALDQLKATTSQPLNRP